MYVSYRHCVQADSNRQGIIQTATGPEAETKKGDKTVLFPAQLSVGELT